MSDNLCKCGKPLSHLDADPDSFEYICRFPDLDPYDAMLGMARAAMRVEMSEANARIAQLESDGRAQADVVERATGTLRSLANQLRDLHREWGEIDWEPESAIAVQHELWVRWGVLIERMGS